MKKYLIGIAAGLALCLTGCAFAAGDTFAMAKDAGYIGIEGGYGYLNTPEATYPKDFNGTLTPYDISNNYATTTEKGNMVWGLHAGYEFKVARVWTLGVQLGYKDLGESKHTSAWDEYNDSTGYTYQMRGSRKITQTAFDGLLTARAFVWKGLDFFAEGGAAFVGSTTDQDLTCESIPPVNVLGAYKNIQPWDGKETVWRFRPEIAFGIGYLFTANVHGYVKYTHISGANNGDDSENNIFEGTGQAMPPRTKVYDYNGGVVGIEYRG